MATAEAAIGSHIASLIPDGATLQMGIGAIPDAVLSRLFDKRDLGVHTEMFSDRVIDLGVAPELVDTPSASGRGQAIARCPTCRVAVWSHYSGASPLVKFVRVGTLDEPDRLPPDIHIFTASKQPWVVLPENVPAMAEYYDRKAHWPADSLARWEALAPRIAAWRESLL